MWTQCLLKRKADTTSETELKFPKLDDVALNTVQTVCWIESKFARKNNLLEDENGEIWKVAETYSSIESEQLDMQNKTQREFEKKLK